VRDTEFLDAVGISGIHIPCDQRKTAAALSSGSPIEATLTVIDERASDHEVK
jgi:hypothetical protein